MVVLLAICYTLQYIPNLFDRLVMCTIIHLNHEKYIRLFHNLDIEQIRCL